MSYAEQLRATRRNKLYLTPGDLLNAAADYFQWCEDHPVLEEQVNVWQGEATRTDIKKVRAFTSKGLATFLGITYARLKGYSRNGEAWSDVLEYIDQVIYTQKFEQAAAGQLNATMISRDLGLADKQEVTGVDGGPIQTEALSARERISSQLTELASRTTNKETSNEDQEM